MVVLLIWGLISFIIGCCGGGKHILTNKVLFWLFAIFGMVPGAIAGENSDYGSIMTFIYAPATAVLLGIVVAIGDSVRQNFQSRPSKNPTEVPEPTTAPIVSAKTEVPIEKVILVQNTQAYKETMPIVGKETTLCPACKTPNLINATQCTNCGFTELSRTFISTEDASDWFEKVVIPHRIKWEQSKKQPMFHTADELYEQMVSSQNSGIATHINESASQFECIDYQNGVEIIRYNGNDEQIIIPSIISGKPVLKLGDSLFENCKWITGITLPSGLIAIGDKVFKNTTLTSIVFPNTLERIGEAAFAFSNVAEMVFPPSVKTIPTKVCEGCKKLHTVIIMGAIEIHPYAFSFCQKMNRLALPETLLTIQTAAFACCHELTTVVLPASLRSIYGDFSCSLRGSIVVLNDNIEWTPANKPMAHGLHAGITIYCNPGSTSQKHALEWGMKMKYLSEYQH